MTVAATFVAVASLTACGGGSSSSDADQIRSVADQAITGDDPSSCEKLVTQHFIEAIYKGSVEQCKKNAEETSDDPDSIDVQHIAVDGTKATADITLVGGPADGQVLHASFVRDANQWKFDAVTSGALAGTTSTGSTATGTGATTTGGDALTNLFFGVIHSQLTRSGHSEAAADCMVRKLRDAITPQEIQELKAGKRTGTLAAKARTAGEQCAHQALSGN